MFKYDNTLKIRDWCNSSEGKKAEKELFAPINGNEKQLYSIGNIVDGNGLGFYTGKIVDVYCKCGFWYYRVEYKLGRKKYQDILRQSDIVLVENN